MKLSEIEMTYKERVKVGGLLTQREADRRAAHYAASIMGQDDSGEVYEALRPEDHDVMGRAMAKLYERLMLAARKDVERAEWDEQSEQEWSYE